MPQPTEPTAPIGVTDTPSLIRLRRRAFRAVLLVGPAASIVGAVIAVATDTYGLLAWSALGLFTSGIAVVQNLIRSSDLRVLVLAHAAATPIAALYAPPGSIPGVVAGSAVAGALLLALTGRRRSTAVAGVAVLVIYAVVMYAHTSGSGGMVGVVALVGGGLVAWAVLTGLVSELRDGEGSYRHLFDRVPVGLYRTAISGEILDANHALGELLGYPRDEVIGMNARDLLYDPVDLDRLREGLAGGADALTTDIRFRSRDGEVIWIRDRTRAVLDDSGTLVFFEGELQDVTEERRHLEELESLVKSKSDLIGAVSHELRTPLTAVVGFLDLLADMVPADQGEQAELLDMAVEQSHEVAGIVEDLLTAARIDNHELVIHPAEFCVSDAVEAAVRSLGVSGATHVTVDIDSGLTGLADAGRVRQILRNLVVNANRYGTPPIRVSAREHEDGHIEVVVSDRGEAIPHDVAANIFEPFFSGASSASQPGSIGLGLSVSRRLARLMGGDLDHRRVGSENHFVLTVNRAPVEAALLA